MKKLNNNQIITISQFENYQIKPVSKFINVKSINNNELKKSHINKKKSFKHWLYDNFEEFSKATALHGYNYIVREEATMWERIFWASLLVMAVITFFILLWLALRWNIETPTVTVIESTHYASWNMPFPSVTICNINKISAATAISLATAMKRPANVTPHDLSKMFRFILHFEGIGNGTTDDYMKLHEIFEMNNLTVRQVIKTIAPSCTEMLKRCMWKGTLVRCDKLFQSTFSTKGQCCSFNYFALKNVFIPTKLIHDIPKVPRKVTACGYQTGLSVLIKPQIFDYHTSFLNSYGFRVYIHHAYDYPDENAETKVVSAKLESFLSVTPEGTYCTSAVRRLSPIDRYCYFDDEIQLSSMVKYSYINCLIECRAKIIYNLCGCIPYHYPSNESFPVCSMAKLDCVTRNSNIYSGALPGINFTNIKLTDNIDVTHTSCNCLPDCELIQYPSEITFGYLNRDRSFNSMSFFKDIDLAGETLMHVFFSDLVSTHYRKDLYQNWLDTLASLGGLLGLLLGFSFVNGFELVYFFSLRKLFDYISNRQQHR